MNTNETTQSLELDLMQKIATIMHEDDAVTVADHDPFLSLSDGLGAHVEPEEETKEAEAQEELEDVEEPKTALASMSMAQVFHAPEFREGVQEALAARAEEISEAVTKVAKTSWYSKHVTGLGKKSKTMRERASDWVGKNKGKALAGAAVGGGIVGAGVAKGSKDPYA